MLKRSLVRSVVLTLYFVFISAIYVLAAPQVRVGLVSDREGSPPHVLEHGESITFTATVYEDGQAVPYEVYWTFRHLLEGDTAVYHGNVATITVGNAEARYRTIFIRAGVSTSTPPTATGTNIRIHETGRYSEEIRISRVELTGMHTHFYGGGTRRGFTTGRTYSLAARVIGNTPGDRSTDRVLPGELIDWEIQVVPHDAFPGTVFLDWRDTGDIFEFNGNNATFTVGPLEPGRFVIVTARSRTLPARSSTFMAEPSAPPAVPATGSVMRFVIGSTRYMENQVARILPAAPFISDGRTMVPLRAIGEALGAEFGFYEGEITVQLDNTTLHMTVGEPLPDNMGTPVIVAGRTFVPIAYIVEKVGEESRWDSGANAVYIYINN